MYKPLGSLQLKCLPQNADCLQQWWAYPLLHGGARLPYPSPLKLTSLLLVLEASLCLAFYVWPSIPPRFPNHHWKKNYSSQQKFYTSVRNWVTKEKPNKMMLYNYIFCLSLHTTSEYSNHFTPHHIFTTKTCTIESLHAHPFTYKKMYFCHA